MRRLLPAFVLLLGGTLSCFAQTSVLPVFRNPTGSGTTEVSAANPLPVNASVSVSASISGFHQESVLTPLSVTVANTTSGAFTAAKTIIVANAGSTNTAYCALGNTATTSGQPVPPQSWVAFTSTVETTVSCITASSTTTVNVSVGTGLPTGAGGGSSSGGGSVTQGTTPWVDNITQWAGGVLGAMANYGTSPGAVLAPGVNAFVTNVPAVTLNAGTNVAGFTSNDPCSQATKLGAPINLTASGQVITGTSAKKTYVCSIDIVSASTQNIALVEGTGSVCATNIFGLAGGTTAATGWNVVANGGLVKGNGAGTVYSPSADANGTAANVCLLLSGSGQSSGQITYVQQ